MTVLLRVRRAGGGSEPLDTPTVPPQVLSKFPKSVVAQIRVMPGNKVVTARPLSGTGTLFFVPVVPL